MKQQVLFQAKHSHLVLLVSGGVLPFPVFFTELVLVSLGSETHSLPEGLPETLNFREIQKTNSVHNTLEHNNNVYCNSFVQ